MATKIVTKNSSTAGSAPSASDLVQGELAVNVADKRLYTEDNAGNIVELGTNPLGEITANGGIALGDNDKATFGAGDDLEIYHDGSNSYITDVGTGDLYIKGGNDLRLETPEGEAGLTVNQNGSVQVYHDNAEKLATTATGIDVTGNVTSAGLSSTSTGRYHYIQNAAGNQTFPSYSFQGDSNTGMMSDAADTLSLVTGGATRVKIDSSGIDVTGTATMDGLQVSTAGTSNAIAKLERATGNTATFTSGAATGFTINSDNTNGGVAITRFTQNGTEAMRIDASGNLLLNTTNSPTTTKAIISADYSVGGTTNTGLTITGRQSGNWYNNGIHALGASGLVFSTGTTGTNGADATNERMRIDASGNVLVGKLSVSLGAVGVEVKPQGEVRATANGAQALQLNRLNSDGTIIDFRKDGLPVGQINVRSNDMVIGTGDTGLQFYDAGDSIFPLSASGNTNRDAAIDLGMSVNRFKDIYATNGTIQTSDAREKTEVRELTDAEMRVAKKLSKNIGFFQWLTAIEKKGADARSHCGQTVQGVIAEFDAEGLDAFDYAMVCYNEWEAEFTEHPAIEAVEAVEAVEGVEAVEAVEAVDAVLDEDGEIVSEAVEAVEAIEGVDAVEAVEAVEAMDAWTEQTQEQGDRFSLRTDQLNHFMIRGLAQSQEELEARLSALEA